MIDYRPIPFTVATDPSPLRIDGDGVRSARAPVAPACGYAGLISSPVPLRFAADDNFEGRILLTHDYETMTRCAYERVIAGEPMPGVILVRRNVQFGELITDILFVADSMPEEKLADQVLYVPLGSRGA